MSPLIPEHEIVLTLASFKIGDVSARIFGAILGMAIEACNLWFPKYAVLNFLFAPSFGVLTSDGSATPTSPAPSFQDLV